MNFVGHILEKRNLIMYSVNNIGFYTLTDSRAKYNHNNLERCEIILTEFCNFKCPYCRGVKSYSKDCSGHLDYEIANYVLDQWIKNGLNNIRFSGGEPTLYPHLLKLIKQSKEGNIQRIAISTNGSRPRGLYETILKSGVNDFSISLDACCAENADKMSGRKGYFKDIVDNIKWLSKETYVTVGIVLTESTQETILDVVMFADSLGVSDIRIITAAQYNGSLPYLERIPQYILNKYPILKYRVNNLLSGKNVRGITNEDSKKCYLVKDDSVVAGKWHFPCVIHMREGGEPIGEVNKNMLQERINWSNIHNTHNDPICVKNCLDCLVDYNNLANQEESNVYNKR